MEQLEWQVLWRTILSRIFVPFLDGRAITSPYVAPEHVVNGHSIGVSGPKKMRSTAVLRTSRKYPVTYKSRGRKGVLTEDVRKILVLGDWEWSKGVDGVIRVIGGILQRVPIPLYVWSVGMAVTPPFLTCKPKSIGEMSSARPSHAFKGHEGRSLSFLSFIFHQHGFKATLTNSGHIPP